MYKVLDVISNYQNARKGVVHITDDFFEKMHPLDKIKVKQVLNALQSEDVLEIFQSNISPYGICVQLTSHAFAYRMHLKEKSFRFWFPSIISIAAIIISAVSATITVLAYLLQ